MNLFTVLLCVAISIALALAQDEPLTVLTPLAAVACQPITLVWAGGVPPYFLNIIPGDEPSAPSLVDFGQVEGYSIQWLVKFPADTALILNLRDGNNYVVQSTIFRVQPGSDTSCLPGSSTAYTELTTASSDTATSTTSSSVTSTMVSVTTITATAAPSTSDPSSSPQSRQAGSQTRSTSVDAGAVSGSTSPPPGDPTDNGAPRTSTTGNAGTGTTNRESKGSKVGTIVGVSVGAAIALMITGCLILVCQRRMRSGEMSKAKPSNALLQPFDISQQLRRYQDGMGEMPSPAGNSESPPAYTMEDGEASGVDREESAPAARQQPQGHIRSKLRKIRLPQAVALPVHEAP